MRWYRSNAAIVGDFSSAVAATPASTSHHNSPTAKTRATLVLPCGATDRSYRGLLLSGFLCLGVQHFDHLVVKSLGFFARVPHGG